MDRVILTASEGMILTDGVTYGTKIYLADGKNRDNFYEITKEEYEKMLLANDEIGEEDTSELAEKANAYDIITGVSE